MRIVEIAILGVGDYRASYMIFRERAAKHRHCWDMAKRIYDRFHKAKQKAAEE